MVEIGLLSDTHGYVHPRILSFFNNCGEIWHAGDLGTEEVADTLQSYKPLRAVYGNIDGTALRTRFPEIQIFSVEDVPVLMMHIGGYPGRYSPKAKTAIKRYRPALFISGHSHILKVQYDQTYKLLHINPGAAGNSGFHNKITAVRFAIDGDRIKDLEVLELGRRS